VSREELIKRALEKKERVGMELIVANDVGKGGDGYAG
jgi:hypothetical protein